MRFSHLNTKLYAAVSTLQFEDFNFLDVKIVQPLLDLVDGTNMEVEFDVSNTYVAKLNGDVALKLELLSEPLPQNVRTLFLF